MIRNFTGSMRKENISAFSASSAFFIFLSFIPLLMLLCTIIPYTPLTEKDIENAATIVIPGVAKDYVTAVIGDVYEQSKTLLPVAAVVLLWTAGKGMMSVVQGLNAINDVEEERNYFMVRFMAMLYTIVFLVIILIGLAIMSFGNLLGDLLIRHIPALNMILSMLLPFRFIVFWVILTVIFSVIYAVIPNKKMKVMQQLPGACFAAVAWSVFSFGFSIYIDYGNTLNLYGSLAILIIMMMWLYFCMYIVFVGAYVNRYYQQEGVL